MKYVKKYEFELKYPMKSKQYIPELWRRWEIDVDGVKRLMVYKYEVNNSIHSDAMHICEPLSLKEIRKMKLEKLNG
jgi:hypothetical protein